MCKAKSRKRWNRADNPLYVVAKNKRPNSDSNSVGLFSTLTALRAVLLLYGAGGGGLTHLCSSLNFPAFLAGIKIWAVCCFTGYCFVGYTDGGFSGDPLLSQWLHCALGRTCRLVLFVLFIACPALGEHLKGSGTYMACDSYFSSPILFLCLKKRGIYAIGTLKSIHRGVLDVKTFWVENSQKLTKKGEMLFARFGNMAFVQWWDSRVVLFLTTIHLKIGRIEYRCVWRVSRLRPKVSVVG